MGSTNVDIIFPPEKVSVPEFFPVFSLSNSLKRQRRKNIDVKCLDFDCKI
jgi:hypothetical protein